MLLNTLRQTRLLSSKMNSLDRTSILKLIKDCIPPLTIDRHKGQLGRIGIIGGSLEYTGAPYFAGISALKVGADLVHIFCSSTSGTVIKSYSPELIVHPILDSLDAMNQISPWLERLHAIVIGPGLGREENTFKIISDIIKVIKEKRIPLIIDADGLFYITQCPELIEEFISPVILTPNKIEFERLCNKTNGPAEVTKLSKYITILKKGYIDEIFCIENMLQWQSTTGGSARRCGGQGDILSGSLAIFLYWTLINVDKVEFVKQIDKTLLASALSSYAASALVRLCNEKAFAIKGRSMLATDMIEYIHESFQELFEE